ncbi:MAG TPA: stage II sporulation protein D [Bacilli bacterium]|nr:stage II sporulation protein D [Bacilli bacterium]
MKKKLLLAVSLIGAVLTVTILLPAGLIAVWPSAPVVVEQKHTQFVQLEVPTDDIQISVFKKGEGKVVQMPLEEYVRGVVAAEMPVNFAPEALKAQAIAARTYVVRRLVLGAKTPEGADVTDDHRDFQAFSDADKLKVRWGDADYQRNLSKMNAAVNETRGEIALYDGQPIEALFFSTSSGKTENSEDYWGKAQPYLRSVESPWDEKSEKYTAKLEMPLSEFRRKLGIDAVVTATNAGTLIQPLERSVSDHIKSIKVGDKTFSGPQLRSLLGLRSTWFTWKVTGDTITFFTKGFGHGVGMSQYGAHFMALEGKKAEDIVRYYYSGVTIGHVEDVLPNR